MNISVFTFDFELNRLVHRGQVLQRHSIVVLEDRRVVQDLRRDQLRAIQLSSQLRLVLPTKDVEAHTEARQSRFGVLVTRNHFIHTVKHVLWQLRCAQFISLESGCTAINYIAFHQGSLFLCLRKFGDARR